MSNAERLPPRGELVEFFGYGFITDTYRTVAEADGYEGDVFSRNVNLLAEDFDYDHPWHQRVGAGSISAQYLGMLWYIHRDSFWDWRCSE